MRSLCYNKVMDLADICGMNWTPLNTSSQLDHISVSESTVLIFKHSIRCGISSMVLRQLEKNWNPVDGLDMYFLDLIKYREVSNEISSRFGVRHESPQLIVLKNGEVIHHASHHEINNANFTEIL
jgi:bacillithiol system protein YtxJ